MGYRSLRLSNSRVSYETNSERSKLAICPEQRKQHLLCIDEGLKEKGNKEQGELVTVEILHLKRPEDVFTLSVEHTTIDNEIAAILKLVRDMDKRAYRNGIHELFTSGERMGVE